MNSRKQTINEILADLKALQSSGYENQYAVAENIVFFEAIRTFPGYIRWLFSRARGIDADRLLELADLPLPKWDRELHRQLSAASKKDFPGMVKPLRDCLVREITNNNCRVLVDLGCGGMEVVVQALASLQKQRYPNKLVVIGVDRSEVVSEVVTENLQPIAGEVEFSELPELDSATLQQILAVGSQKHRIVLCKNDIFELDTVFGTSRADIVFHSRFKHHLTAAQKQQLDNLLQRIAKVSVEFDEYKDMFLPIPQGIATWGTPPLMNGAVFSRIREIPKQEAARGISGSEQIQFFGLLGAYLRINRIGS